MGKPRGVYINTQEDEKYELNDWLDRNGYRETLDNREVLRKLIEESKKILKKQSSDNLKWTELDDIHQKNKEIFAKKLAKKI